jgi:hypothetical protein
LRSNLQGWLSFASACVNGGRWRGIKRSLTFLWDRPEKDEKTDKKIPENGYLCPGVLYEYRDRRSGGFAHG